MSTESYRDAVIDENNLVLYQKVGYRNIKEVCSNVADISFTIGRVVGARRATFCTRVVMKLLYPF